MIRYESKYAHQISADAADGANNAAQTVFATHGVADDECYAAIARCAADDEQPGDGTLCYVWSLADQAAARAAFSGWHRIPEDAVMVLS